MRFEAAPLSGAYLIYGVPNSDERGSFARTFCADEFSAMGLNTQWQQANVASSVSSGIIRGLHYQKAPHAETKLVSCIRGRIFDVIVDMRKASATFHQWFGVQLEGSDHTQLYVPQGFAHGYQVLEDDSCLSYLVSAAYAPESEAGVRWDDPTIAINWPNTAGVQLSDKDKLWPLLS